MHSMFVIKNIENPPKMAVFLVGLMDMGYAFCLFWPANILPIFIIVCQMQLFIPLDTLFGKLICGKQEFMKHVIISVVILFGVGFSFVSMFT